MSNGHVRLDASTRLSIGFDDKKSATVNVIDKQTFHTKHKLRYSSRRLLNFPCLLHERSLSYLYLDQLKWHHSAVVTSLFWRRPMDKARRHLNLRNRVS